VEQTKPRLQEDTVWYLEDSRDLAKSVVAYPRPKQQQDRTGFFMSSYGGYGRYVKRALAELRAGRAEVSAAPGRQVHSLPPSRFGSDTVSLEQVRSGDVPGYQINADALRWMARDGEIRQSDRTRLLEVARSRPRSTVLRGVYRVSWT